MEPISTTVTGVLAVLRTAKEAAKHIKDAELTERLQDAYDRIGDIRHAIFSLEDENRRLLRELEELKDTKKIESELKFDGLVYWRIINGQKTGPFCPNCWHDHNNRQLFPLRHQGGNAFYCTVHKLAFGGGSMILGVGRPSRFDQEF